MLAAQLGYRGTPAPRFWVFEDAGVDFGDPGGGERDIGRLLLAEIALAWGNDWFLVPLDVPTGALVRVNEQLARWHDGRRTAWIGRLRHPGVGELRSQLEFDSLVPNPGSTGGTAGGSAQP